MKEICSVDETDQKINNKGKVIGIYCNLQC